jgi:nucleotide-binding universal stress UspA family protein
VERAALLAGRLGAPLRVATAFHRTHPSELGPPSERAKMPGEGWMSTGYQAAIDVARDASSRAARLVEGLETHTITVEGEPAESLLEITEQHPGSLLAIGSQGMTGSQRFLLGSVPNKVSHHAVGDLLIYRTGGGAPAALPERVLLATDGSATAERVVARGLDLAAAIGTSVTLLAAGDDKGHATDVLEAAEARAAEASVAAETRFVPGDPAEAIVEVGAEHGLVVVGNRGMTGASRFFLGSVPNNVSHHGTTDLLIVKTTD